MKNQKNISIFALSLGAFLFFSSASYAKDVPISFGELPNNIQTYVSSHFSDKKVLQVVKDVEMFTKTYDLKLEGGISLGFNSKGEIIEIDSSSKLPDTVIQKKILDYVHTHYSSNFITEWERKGKLQKIKLSNKIEIIFTGNGEFLGIDD